jgi:hypothetical protein
VKRSPLKRRTPLKARGGRRFKHPRDPDYLVYRRSQPCLLASADCWGRIDPHHEPPLSRGGTDNRTVSLCQSHHARRTATTLAKFNAQYKVDLEAEAVRLHRAYVESEAA